MLSNQTNDTLHDQTNHSSKPLWNPKADLFLHTVTAQSYFDKSWMPGKIGLKQFATITKTIYQAYKNDDPYAHWVLLKTYQKLYKAIEHCKLVSQQLDEYFKSLRGVKPRLDKNDAQWARPLSFTVFCPYLGAELLAHVDYVLMQLNAIRQFGILQKGEPVTKKTMIDLLQQVFSFPCKWRHSGITRQDVRDNNQKALHAKELLQELRLECGELPEEVLDKKIEFSFLPKI